MNLNSGSVVEQKWCCRFSCFRPFRATAFDGSPGQVWNGPRFYRVHPQSFFTPVPTPTTNFQHTLSHFPIVALAPTSFSHGINKRRRCSSVSMNLNSGSVDEQKWCCR
ncbi:uncharacterized protein LOC143299453 [Babylonia areolata]|uniref:uncharacterized protein LOC143299453 n=1 Tax=Babylonia areolata TaxID=304850 RepID=UPI003FD52B62